VSKFDAIIVGAGAGGGIAAAVLTSAGKSVLLLERGKPLGFDDIGRDHLRNQRFSRYGINAGPDLTDKRVFVDVDGHAHEVNPIDNGYSNNAACVGSGTIVYGGQAWRFPEEDFRMASIYGIPDGSSLADWPIGYADLAPYYEKVEWELGVSGDSETIGHVPAFSKPYPMPPVPMNAQGNRFQAAARELGWRTSRVPLLINSVPYGGRPACINCQHCVGFACPVDAKTGTQNTTIAKAIASGRCTLVAEAMVERITTDIDGNATGVAYLDGDGVRREAQSEVVVLAGGAIESARLLLNSPTSREPAGIGNNHDQVGRHLQGHYYAGAVGLFEDDLWDGIGPGVTTGTTQFNHYNDGYVGGGLLADEFIISPINFWAWALPPDLPKWGAENKRFMRENYRRVLQIKGPTHEIPHPDCRVTLDPNLRDKFGIPAVRLSGHTHPETVRTATYLDSRAREWLTSAGATRVWGGGHSLRLSAGQHQAGTCRMGNAPATSVVDRHGRVHGHTNVFVADGSVHTTNGGFNPVLTIMATAWRTAEGIVNGW
jgi:choline dehydrogenase-like flavoprotein